jgi:hypothetical protein
MFISKRYIPVKKILAMGTKTGGIEFDSRNHSQIGLRDTMTLEEHT